VLLDGVVGLRRRKRLRPKQVAQEDIYWFSALRIAVEDRLRAPA
jgi:hypothetical protein